MTTSLTLRPSPKTFARAFVVAARATDADHEFYVSDTAGKTVGIWRDGAFYALAVPLRRLFAARIARAEKLNQYARLSSLRLTVGERQPKARLSVDRAVA